MAPFIHPYPVQELKILSHFNQIWDDIFATERPAGIYGEGLWDRLSEGLAGRIKVIYLE